MEFLFFFTARGGRTYKLEKMLSIANKACKLQEETFPLALEIIKTNLIRTTTEFCTCVLPNS